MKPLPHLVLATAAALLVSCSNHTTPSAPVGAKAYTPSATSTRSRVLVKTATMHITVPDVKKAGTQTQNLVKQHKGYLESTNTSDTTHARLTLRIPAARLAPVMDALSCIGKVTSRNVRVKDVTSQWIDIQAKLKNTRALRDRLRKLLREAKTVKETLEVEKELTRVQSELDALEAQIKTLQKQASYSKLTVSLHQKTIPGPIGAVAKGTWWSLKKLFILR